MLVVLLPLAMARQIGAEQAEVVVEVGRQAEHRTPFHQGAVEQQQPGAWSHGSPWEAGVAGRGSPTLRITRQGLP